MKIMRVNNKLKLTALLLPSFLIIGFSGVKAQTETGQPATKPVKMRHYLGAWIYGGYSAMFHNIDQTKVLGGAGGGLGGVYQLRINKFLFNTGVEFEFLNSATSVQGLDGVRRILDTQNKGEGGNQTGKWVQLQYKYDKYRDCQNVGIVNIPILAGMRFKANYDFYFLAGAKIGLPVLGINSTRGVVTTSGKYEEYIDSFVNMPQHYFGKQIINRTRRSSDFGPINIMASAEFGIELNQWIDKALGIKTQATKPTRGVRGKKQYQPFERETPRMRAAIFADYGLLSINNNKPSQDIISEPSGFENQPKEKVLFTTNNLLQTPRAFVGNKPKSVNPFIVGVKGTVFFDVTRAKLLPPPPPPPPQFIVGKIIDVETGGEISGSKIQMTDPTGKVLYTEQPKYGIFNTKIRRDGTYTVNVTAPNYYSYSEIASNVGDTLMIYLQPIKKGEKFVLKNIYFDFDKAELTAQSNAELDKQAEFIKENTEINFLIVGYTDSKGSDEHNMKLSQDRANAVMNALILRGVSPDRLKAEGRGKANPIATNDTEQGRAENRRIEIEFQ